MGAVVIEGGQGENPSAADLARAVEETGAPVVVVLPNNKNIVPTAEQVGELVEARDARGAHDEHSLGPCRYGRL